MEGLRGTKQRPKGGVIGVIGLSMNVVVCGNGTLVMLCFWLVWRYKGRGTRSTTILLH